MGFNRQVPTVSFDLVLQLLNRVALFKHPQARVIEQFISGELD